MADRKLRLVKKDKNRAEWKRPRHERQRSTSPQLHVPERASSREFDTGKPEMEIDNPSEAAEAERFRALTVARAAQQAMIRRIMAELLEVDPPAA